ncbi:MAG TPA: septum formation initiator family protein [Ferruginibacter sp.]|nr:septum formation initiator family protein [Ferruginibacter sp.]
MKLLSYIPSWLKNKYLIASMFFLVWMIFFDPKDIPSDIARRDKYRELERNEAHLDQLIAETQDELTQLKTNAQTIEKYAREKYQMKKDNEDLFIVSTPSSSSK